MKYVIPCLSSFLLTVAIMPLVIRLANACNCLDVPGGRRLHDWITPRWGGVAFFAGVLPLLLIENRNGALTSYIIASCLLVGLGMMDDLRSLSWKTKLAGMTAAATIVIFGGDISVHHIGSYGSLGRVELGWLSIPVTYLGIIGITNAINLLDGLNGLAGGVSLLGFLFMGIAAALSGNVMIALVCFAFVGALAGFLLYNFPNARVFMGDSGSIFLGFSLSLTAVNLTQEANSAVDSMFPVLVLLIPIFDTLRVLVVRLLNGKNPFQADRLHLHYLILEKNISAVTVVLLFWFVTVLFGGIALTVAKTSAQYLIVVLYASLLLSLFAVSLTRKRQTPEEGRLGTRRPDALGGGPVGLPRYYNPSSDFARKGGIMTLKWMVGLGIMLLAAQVSAGKMSLLASRQDKSRDAAGASITSATSNGRGADQIEERTSDINNIQ